jgi:hypothetical protein
MAKAFNSPAALSFSPRALSKIQLTKKIRHSHIIEIESYFYKTTIVFSRDFPSLTSQSLSSSLTRSFVEERAKKPESCHQTVRIFFAFARLFIINNSALPVVLR